MRPHVYLLKREAGPPSHPADANNKGERRGAEWAVVTGARSTAVEAAASSSAPSPRCSSRSAPSSPGGAPRATVGPRPGGFVQLVCPVDE